MGQCGRGLRTALKHHDRVVVKMIRPSEGGGGNSWLQRAFLKVVNGENIPADLASRSARPKGFHVVELARRSNLFCKLFAL